MMAYDAVRMDGRTSFTFFGDDSDANEVSATVEHEKQMVNWLFNYSRANHLLYDEINIPYSYQHHLEVQQPIIDNPRKKPGDIDVLLRNPGSPQYSIAIECKRVKGRVLEDGQEKVNKIEGLWSGIQQANALRELGFYKTYLMIFVVMDGRFRKDTSQIFRRISSEKLASVYDFEGFGELHENVGIIICQIAQTSGKSVYETGTVALREHKKARQQEQFLELSNRIGKIK
ncbi:MAG: hypothetical protein BroJett020_14350 [Bacteroidota bacterium]|nr:MAG: hypothetical protein BroJett020_14350 [Bacteroidota bacterium]